MNFRIKGLASAQFEHLFGLSDDNLKAFNAKRYIAGSKPGFPCRLTLEDADPGETLLLAPYRHQTSRTAYASEGPIFIREHHARPAEYINEIPEQIRSRLISLRTYDGDGMMIDADVVDGTLVQPLIKRFLTDERTGLALRRMNCVVISNDFHSTIVISCAYDLGGIFLYPLPM